MPTPQQDVSSAARVLVYAPIGRDAELTCQLLEQASIPCEACDSIASLNAKIADSGAGAVVLTEEALDAPDFPSLGEELQQQPPWSEVPVLLFAGSGTDVSLRAIRSIDALRNVTLLERPIRVAVVLSTVRAALRSRARQYEVRDLLVALHRARTEAESANRLKDEFLATLSHELRTPLNAILGWTSMLTRGQIEPGRFARVFEALDRNAQAQAQLIADVLDVSRIITGKLQLQPTTVDVCDVVLHAADAVRPAATAKGVSLTVGETADCWVFGDADRLRQVFWNVLSNATKFTPPGGTIDVEVIRNGTGISVIITDTGVGMRPEFVPFVFDRFRQADQTTTRAHGGLGLGLSIVKHLTELHGGTVVASSEGVDRGARFEIRLPAAIAAPPAATFDARSETDNQLDGRSILVVDDDQSTRDVVSAALEAAHGEVRIAASAAEARQQLSEHTPAIIIADLGMPVEDGFSFIRDVRQSDARAIPAIALSAYADAASRNAALAAGFDAFLAKPTRPQVLVKLVLSVLNGSK
jgi:signal transduction histidine kinase